jgi:hypothetical protein
VSFYPHSDANRLSLHDGRIHKLMGIRFAIPPYEDLKPPAQNVGRDSFFIDNAAN